MARIKAWWHNLNDDHTCELVVQSAQDWLQTHPEGREA